MMITNQHSAEPRARRPVAILGLAAALAAAVACNGAEDPTSLRVRLVHDPDWGLTSLQVAAGDRGDEIGVTQEVTVIVPDEWAGQAVRLTVAGYRADARWAFGAADAVPERGQRVDVTVALSRLPCGAWCYEGETRCAGEGVSVCEQRDEDDCLEWSEVVPCPVETPECSLGVCAVTCFDECAAGETRCAGPEAVEICGDADADDCLEWQPALACDSSTVCSLGVCRETCLDECAPGEERCLGAGLAACVDANDDGCLEWGPPESCPDGTTCSAGACSAECTNECEGATCDGLLFRACGNYDLDDCLEASPGLSCAPADPCQVGNCSPTGGCSSAAMVCDDPPESDCVNGDTLYACDAVGACVAGTCDYDCQEIACPNCPACDPCANMTCDDPPQPVVCYQSPGTCTDGSCDYDYADGETCTDGDDCTLDDTCDTGVCAGTEMVCDDPPDPICQDAVTLRTWSGPGTCSGGDCGYPYTDTPCDDFPEPTCLNPSTLRIYSGACEAADCVYSHADATCALDETCTAGACQCVETECAVDLLASGTDADGAIDIALDETHLYWANGWGGVMRMAKASDSAEMVTDDSSHGIALDQTHIYWTSYANVRRRAKAGGGIETLASEQEYARGIAVDATHVYWTDCLADTVMRVAKAGGTVETLATEQDAAEGITLDDDEGYVYWTNDLGSAVMRAPKAGGTVETIASEQDYSKDVEVDETHVYWTYVHGVRRRAKAGGTIVTLVSAQDYAWDLTLDATHVYWTNTVGDQVMRMTKSGADVEVLATEQESAAGIALDDTHLYWTNDYGDQVARLPRCPCGL